MLVIPVIAALLFLVYVRPQEILPALQAIPLVHLTTLAVPPAWALDARLGFSKPRLDPLLFWGIAFWGWCVFTVVLRPPDSLARDLAAILPSLILYLAIGSGIQSFRMLGVLAGAIVALAAFLTVVGLAQAGGGWQCVTPGESGGQPAMIADGRTCQTRLDCLATSVDDEAEYGCERVGPFDTTTVDGRIRYRGIVGDPNEFALVIALGLPLAFVPFAVRGGALALAVALAALAVTAPAVVLTRSRSGQLAFLLVVGVYLLRRLRAWGALAAALVVVPILALGGRSGGNAEASTALRLEAWVEGLAMWRSSPLIGIGRGQYVLHHSLTAHNSYILTLAELGAAGAFLWVGMFYFAFKSVMLVWRRAGASHAAHPARVWSAVLLSCLCALVASTSFLSLAYHPIAWTYFGLTAAVTGAARRHDPELQLRVRLFDLIAIMAITVALGVGIAAYCHFEGAG